jgi:hypothetical protein
VSYEIIEGDCVAAMREMAPDSIDSIVCDPPYFLHFMGRKWDHAPTPRQQQEQHEKWAREALRVLKPGGYLVAFSGTRTYHRMVCAIEDAGFEIRDSLHWIYGSGFPKSLDVSKQIDKMAPRLGKFAEFAAHYRSCRQASGLSPREVAAYFPSKSGGLTGCASNWETGLRVPTRDQWAVLQPLLKLSDEWLPLIDRIEAEREVVGKAEWTNSAKHFVPGEDHTQRVLLDITAPATEAAKEWQGFGTALKPSHDPIVLARKSLSEKSVASNVLKWGTGAINVDGTRVEGKRWPPNLLLSHSESCNGDCVEGCPVRLMDEQSGNRPSTGHYPNSREKPDTPRSFVGVDLPLRSREAKGAYAGDTGGASRFFPNFRYTAKASRRERNAGLEGMPEREHQSGMGGAMPIDDQGRDRDRLETVAANHHPTVKPIDLMRWIVRLVTPPGGTVLDPFAGSGSTGCAAVLEKMEFIGIEMDPEYAEIARRRIAYWSLPEWARPQPKPATDREIQQQIDASDEFRDTLF